MNKSLGPKRSTKVTKACDRCRQKKRKCDALQPVCSACRIFGETCKSSQRDRKRGLPQGYVRRLEELLSFAITNIGIFEEEMISILCRGKKSLETDSEGSSESSAWLGQNVWKESYLYKVLNNPTSDNIDGLFSTRNLLLSEEQNVTRESVGASLDWTTYDAKPRNVAAKSLDFEASSTGSVENESSCGYQSTCWAPLPATAHHLLDQYFINTHPWLPILDREAIARTYHQQSTASCTVPFVTRNSSSFAPLWALFSYITAQNLGSGRQNPAKLSSESKRCYLLARSLLPKDGRCYELGHSQALLLLILVNVSFEQWDAARVLNARNINLLAMRMPHQNLRKPENLNSQGERALLMGGILIDLLLAPHLSQKPNGDIFRNETILLSEEGHDEWTSWPQIWACPKTPTKPTCMDDSIKALSCFNRLFQLSNMAALAQDASNIDDIEFAQRIIQNFAKWESNLPLGCRLISSERFHHERHVSLFPHQTYLTLKYSATLLSFYSTLAEWRPLELTNLHPAVASAKSLLYRVISILKAHRDNFSSCTLPPVSVLCLRETVKYAQKLGKLQPCEFPIQQWARALCHIMPGLCPLLPVSGSLFRDLQQIAS